MKKHNDNLSEIKLPETPTPSQPLPTSSKVSLPPLYFGITIGTVVTLVISFALFSFFYNAKNSPNTQTSTLSPGPTNLNASPSAYMITDVPPTETPVTKIEGITLGNPEWFTYPKIIKLNSVLSDYGLGCAKNISYQQTASFPDGSKLVNLIFTDTCGMGESSALYRIIQLPNNLTYLLVKDTDSMQYYGQYFTPTTKYTNVSISGVDPPTTLDTKAGKFVTTNYFMSNVISFTQISNPKLIEDTKYGSLYASYAKNSDQSTSGKMGMLTRSLYLRLKDDTVQSYTIDPGFISDDQIPRIKWSDGTTNANQFTSAPKDKCGGNSNDILKSDSPYVQGLTESGLSTSGTKTYRITDTNNLVLKEVYDQYSTMGYDPNGKAKISITDFVGKNSHLLWQDGLGDWHVLVDQTYAPAVECGKPVIYLYPQKDTQVSVKVAASITQSEPHYPQNGWTVMAHPNGQLDYQHQTYPNLFWEGTGHGIYPEISNLGFVIPKNNLIPTIKDHLSKLGLNQTETSDFLEFWADKLPTTPYTRLTWITTQGMNQLAPLTVNPVPDTSIRVFLDFEGLNSPIYLAPQKLSAPARNGFTLIEWGGLLRK